MSSATQQILCCVGTTVTSRPTQFIMERAFNALGLDWRALTVEIEPEKLSVALEGMAAMGFRALRIYPSLGSTAVQLLGTDNPEAMYVGRATSAILTNDHWSSWDNAGFALLEWLSTRVDWQQTLLYVHRDNAEHRSLLAAIHQTGVLPRVIAWRKSSVELPPWLTQEQPSSLPDSSLQLPYILRAVEDAWEDGLVGLVEEFQRVGESETRQDFRPTMLLLGTDQLPITQLSNAGVEHIFILAAEVGGTTAASRESEAQTQLSALTYVPATELLVEAEVYDFARWTGYPIDRPLVRDAYDEFSDF